MYMICLHVCALLNEFGCKEWHCFAFGIECGYNFINFERSDHEVYWECAKKTLLMVPSTMEIGWVVCCNCGITFYHICHIPSYEWSLSICSTCISWVVVASSLREKLQILERVMLTTTNLVSIDDMAMKLAFRISMILLVLQVETHNQRSLSCIRVIVPIGVRPSLDP